MPHYKLEKHEGIWTNIDEVPYKHRLGELFLNGDQLVFSSSIETLINMEKESKPWKVRSDVYASYIEKAKKITMDIISYYGGS